MGLDGRGGLDVEAVRGQGGVASVERTGLITSVAQRAVHGVLERAPVHAAKHRGLPELADLRVDRAEHVGRWAVPARAEDEIDVPRYDLPAPAGRVIQVGILAAPKSIGVPVPDDVLEREGPHPAVDVDEVGEERGVTRVGSVDRLDQAEKLSVVVGGFLNGAFAPGPAVARELQVVAERAEALQRGVPAEDKVVAGVAELEPVLDLEQVAVPSVREPVVDVQSVRFLCVLGRVP